MLDDDADDLYLLEAVESVENLHSNNKVKTNEKLYLETNYQTLAASSDNSQMTDIKFKADFRSRLLLTLSSRENKPECITRNKIIGPSINSDSLCIDSSTNAPKKSNSLSSVNMGLKNHTGHDLELLKKINSSISMNVISPNSFERHSSQFKLSSPVIADQNKNKNSLTPTFRKRKFPGPAGILPNWTQESSFYCLEDDVKIAEKQHEKKRFCAENTICSQNSADNFWGAWKIMTSDFLRASKCNPLEYVNIRWLLRRVTFRGDVVSQKIPFLVVMVQSIDLSHHDATVVFKDETGQMNGIISSSLIDKYATLISQGTVMVLKDATVLSPAGFRICASLKEQQRKHYINVTSNSLVSLYSQDDIGKVTKTEIAELKEEELKLLLTESIKHVEPRAVVEENEHESENEALELSLFSNGNSSFLASDNQNSVECQKLPFKNLGSSTDSPTRHFQNTSRFSNNNLNKVSPYPNSPIKRSNSTHFICNKNNLARSTKGTCISRHENIPVPHSNNLMNINNVKISRPSSISLSSSDIKINDAPNMQDVNERNTLSCNPNHVSLANDRVNVSVASPDYSKPEVGISKTNVNFKFVNKSLFSTNQTNLFDDDSLVPKQFSSLISSNRSKTQSSNEKKSLLLNLPTTMETVSNISNIFDDEEDEDLEFLLANIDTDSILSIK